MTVYVVMSNDYPDAVFAHEADAEAYVTKRNAENVVGKSRIYWRYYPFVVR